MHLARSWLITCVLAVLTSGCNDVQIGSSDPTDSANVGSVEGRVCAPTGDSWLENAYVYTNVVDFEGNIIGIRESWTDRDGYFVLNRIPVSSVVTIYVTRGTYQTSFYAEVKKGALTSLAEPSCLDPLSFSAAVVTGEYDSFSSMLDTIGVTNYTVVDGTDEAPLLAFLSSLDAMLGFDLICVNGGIVEEGVIDDPVVAANITAYVEAGGSLFATDWSYDLIERGFPGAVDFLGDDTILDAAEAGVAAVVSDARVVDQSLASYLGKESVEIRYDLSYWPLIEGAGSQVLIHVTGDVSYYVQGSSEDTIPACPLLISFSAGYGSVVFSTFREESNLNDDMAEILQYMLYRL